MGRRLHFFKTTWSSYRNFECITENQQVANYLVEVGHLLVAHQYLPVVPTDSVSSCAVSSFLRRWGCPPRPPPLCLPRYPRQYLYPHVVLLSYVCSIYAPCWSPDIRTCIRHKLCAISFLLQIT